MSRSFDELVGRVFENPRDEDLVQELSERLEANADECREYFEHSRLQGDLYFVAKSEAAERKALDDLGAAELAPPTLKGPQFSKRRYHPKFLSFLALAASLAGVVGWFGMHRGGSVQEGLRQPTIVATVVSAEDAVWSDGNYFAGQALRAGRSLELKEGIAKVNLPIGVELVLQAPCKVQLQSPEHVFVEEGKLTARVATWTSNFLVETSSLKVFNLGKQFAVEVDQQGNTEAHVLEGEIRVQPLAQADKLRNSFLLSEGEAVRTGPTASTPARLEAEEGRFLTNHGDFRPYHPIDIFNSGRGLAVGDEDPHWRIVQGAIGEGFSGEQYAVVCEPDSRYLPNQPLVSQWVSVAKDVRPGCLPNSAYTFETEFDLTGYDISTVVILADMLADNGVRAVRINGQAVDLVPWKDNQYLQEFHRYRRAEIVSGFVQGKNVIEIDVWNGVYHFGQDESNATPTPNPMALRVEWQAFGVPKTPSTSEARNTI